ncbi:hypothetical protein LJC32_04210 [Oscillospiraceae bacterium OttesenSCG-928-F05]|nr:hypothetical protein [Oscillospiraceae bacterium OttesenSCG-928-F05]
MLNVQSSEVFNFHNAIRGARNPKNSWGRMDSTVDSAGNFVFGDNDLSLAVRLCRAGSDHRKFMRQIFVSADICAPIYWWKEFDTYKVGTVANSTSTMHKIHAKPFTLADFSCEKLTGAALAAMEQVLSALESLRLSFLESKDKDAWYQMIQLLPSSYNQLRTCTFSYENLVAMVGARRGHKLDEWRAFCGWAESLPYAKELILSGVSGSPPQE